MDIIFNCPHCEQELAVDSSGAGSEIECPACSETILIPEKSTAAPPAAESEHAAPPPPTGGVVNAIASSAAAKVEMHLKVPVTAKPTVSLITKASKPLEVAAKESDKSIRVKTIRHTDCVEVGHDKFDEFVTTFLNKVGQQHIISITPLTYTHLDIGSQKLMTEYGVFIVYKG
jgi:DNA-directed RNA polymerase subunit RPC12/RpoP